MVETEGGAEASSKGELRVSVFLDILEDIGPKLYTGKDTWIREYIQNSVDSGAKSVALNFLDRDLIINDDGSGMNEEELYREAFSLGGSKKDTKKIGELGIGMYAAIGTCSRMVVITKRVNETAYEAVFDSTRYKNLVDSNPIPTFEDGMRDIFAVRRSDQTFGPEEHFTRIRFEGLSSETFENFSQYRIAWLVENNINVPVSKSFKHKANVERLLGQDNPEIKVILNLDGETTEMQRFYNLKVEFADTFIQDEMTLDGKTVAKVWAVYPRDGETFVGNKILLKHKGMVIGDGTVVKSRFKVEVSPRFLGEIVLLSDELQINTERNWFVTNKGLDDAVNLVANFLRKLDSDAETDTAVGNGLERLVRQKLILKEKLENARREKNQGTALQIEQRMENLDIKIKEKMEKAKEILEGLDKKETPLDTHEQLKAEVIRDTLQKIGSESKDKGSENAGTKKPRRDPIPEMVKTILMKYIDKDLAPRIKKKDFKDTSQNAYSFIDDLLKERLGIKASPYSSEKYFQLVEQFVKEFRPPFDLKPSDEQYFKKSLEQLLKSSHFFFRNTSSHTNKLESLNDPRYILQSVYIADFLVYLVKSMKRGKDA